MADRRTLPWYRWGPDAAGPPGQEPAGGRLIGRPPGAVRVYLRRAAWDTIDDLAALAGPSQEVGGLLLGQAWRDATGSVIVIEAALPAPQAAQGPGGFHLSQEDWDAFYREWRRQDPPRLVVGWFHTHPGYGARPSGRDRALAQRYFPEWWQLTYIVDPINWRQGMFCWRDGTLAPLAGFWVYDGGPGAPEPAAKGRPTAAASPSPRPRSGPWSAAAWAAALLVLAALAWLPGMPGSLPALREAYRQQVSEAQRLATELAALHARHAALQEALSAVRAAGGVPDAAVAPAGLPPAGPPAATAATPPGGDGLPMGGNGPSPAGDERPPGRTALPPAGAAEALAITSPPAPAAAATAHGDPAEAGPPPAAPAHALRYVVREGDTLWAISADLLGDPLAYSRLAAANRITNPDLILPGWELRLPAEDDPGADAGTTVREDEHR